jgi:hypothetical protein
VTVTLPAPAAAATQDCPHIPPCPEADAVDHDAAKVIAEHHEQGWVLLCNHVIVFDDTGELVGTTPVAPHRPEPPHHRED